MESGISHLTVIAGYQKDEHRAHPFTGTLPDMIEHLFEHSVGMRKRLIEQADKAVEVTLNRFLDERNIVHYLKFVTKLVLLDAYALIYRAYYAFMKNPRINSKGLNTSAVMGFVNILNEVLTKEKPAFIGVAFDPSGPTFRHEAYKEYKAQREECPEDIRKAVPIIKNILKAWNIPVLQVDGFEADDVIGTLATKASEKGVETYMLTPDKDYGQLVKENVFMYRPRYGDAGYEILGVSDIEEKYGISSPLQVIDLLGLMGDAADNIPGCPGVGEKTAVKLINEFGSVENLITGKEKLKGALKKKVEENIEH